MLSIALRREVAHPKAHACEKADGLGWMRRIPPHCSVMRGGHMEKYKKEKGGNKESGR